MLRKKNCAKKPIPRNKFQLGPGVNRLVGGALPESDGSSGYQGPAPGLVLPIINGVDGTAKWKVNKFNRYVGHLTSRFRNPAVYYDRYEPLKLAELFT